MRWLDLPFDLPWSLPSRERGLKYDCFTFSFGIVIVAPFTGAWIEISKSELNKAKELVAPFTGAWIEILARNPRAARIQSLPSRERGLKYITDSMKQRGYSRSLHGSVD